MSSVVIIDDHPIVRMAINILLKNEGHHVVAETGNGEEALTLIEHHYPEVIIIDIDLDTYDGLTIVEHLRAQSFPGIIIVLSGKNADFYGPRSARAGANGFISKNKHLSELVSAIQTTQKGYGYFPLRTGYGAGNEFDSLSDCEKIESLSPQEFQTFQYLIRGLGNVKIGKRMNISNKTVSTYKTRLLEKLGCRNQLELFDFARRNHFE
ncbi:response regulator [Buttiauxella sp. A111]|uniref:response regulator n=1 Tax=Buttiauxella sp. A111 TaxID=2563088 RepID=UPI0010E260D7|nr:response regulator [Buttiauxella sp. A111]GDX05299.1 DNA-binding response regulator [Buttiauxella sp. A111]